MISKAAVLVLIALLALGGLLIFVDRIPQWPEYHDFADDRVFLGIPNAYNVISNIAVCSAPVGQDHYRTT